MVGQCIFTTWFRDATKDPSCVDDCLVEELGLGPKTLQMQLNINTKEELLGRIGQCASLVGGERYQRVIEMESQAEDAFLRMCHITHVGESSPNQPSDLTDQMSEQLACLVAMRLVECGCGWDKDGDHNVVEGHRVGPLPVGDSPLQHGESGSNEWRLRYNTRWGPAGRFAPSAFGTP